MTALVNYSSLYRRQIIYIIYSRVNLCEPITNTYPEEDSRFYSRMTYHSKYTEVPTKAMPLNADRMPPACP